MHFLEIISADIVFKFCRYTHVSINRGWGLRSHHLQRCTQGDQNAAIPLPPKRPKMAQVNILLDITKKATFDYKRLVFITCYLFITYKRNPISFQKWGTSLKLGTSQTSLSGSAIDDPSTCRRFFFTKIAVHPKSK